MLGPTNSRYPLPTPTVGGRTPNASVLLGREDGSDAVTTDCEYSLPGPGLVRLTSNPSRSTPSVYTLTVNAIGWAFFVGMSGGPKAELPVPMSTTSA